jgi:uncharacterized protein with HEPN domain
MKDRNEKLFLADIQECCQKIERYVSGISESDFQANEILKDALVRNIEIIGEAAKNLSEQTRNVNPTVPWREVMRMRDKIVHHYFRLKLEIIWRTVTEDIPNLHLQINKILEKYDEK